MEVLPWPAQLSVVMVHPPLLAVISAFRKQSMGEFGVAMVLVFYFSFFVFVRNKSRNLISRLLPLGSSPFGRTNISIYTKFSGLVQAGEHTSSFFSPQSNSILDKSLERDTIGLLRKSRRLDKRVHEKKALQAFLNISFIKRFLEAQKQGDCDSKRIIIIW